MRVAHANVEQRWVLEEEGNKETKEKKKQLRQTKYMIIIGLVK